MLQEMTRVPEILDVFEETFGIFVADAEGIIQEVNERFCEILSSERTDLLKQSYQNINLQLDDIEDFYPTIDNGGVWKGPVKYMTRDRIEKWLYLMVVPLQNANGKIHRYITLCSNVSEYLEIRNGMNTTIESLRNINKALDEASIVAITDEKGVITHVNDKFCEISQYNREELVGKTHRVINSNYHPPSFFNEMWETILAGEVWNGEVKNKAKDGSYYWMNTTIVPILNEAGKVRQLISIRTDITLRIKAEDELARVMESDFKKVVQNLQSWVFKTKQNKDDNIIVLLSEGRLAEELGVMTDVAYGKNIFKVFNEKLAEKLEGSLQHAFDGNVTHLEALYEDRYIDIMLSPVVEEGRVIEVVGAIADITDRKKAEDTIFHMAHHDTLTGLANRSYFTALLTEAIAGARKANESLGVMFIDLDRFKNINDSLGHLTGDYVLKKVAAYLEGSVRKYDVVSRQGGDEFTIYLPDADQEEARLVAERIMQMLAEPLTVEHLELPVTASIGISMYPRDGKTVEELMKNADAAMYVAKSYGRNNYQFYTGELHESILSKLELEIDLRKALERNQLELYYQPKVEVTSHQIIGVEALIRWHHPEYGLISPNEFIPIAEEAGFIIEIGEWVLKTASKQMKEWHDEGHDRLTVAVNISLRQFLQKNLHIVVRDIVAETGLNPKYLELEITESMTMDVAHTTEMLHRIKELGALVSIDDFGTGYSSLSCLSQFPVDKLKIDQSFVQNLNETNKSIIKAIINIADSLNIDVIAEGVEEKEHLEFLISQSCTEAQGYLFGKPVPVAEMTQLLNEESSQKA